MTRPRIVSLLPSPTEIVTALGVESALVGRSHECDYLAGVERLPVCTEPKIDPRGSTEEIQRGEHVTIRRRFNLLEEIVSVHGERERTGRKRIGALTALG